MSFESDQRVVEVQFNNKQFEADVSTTISTLDKLQNKLQFDGATKGFSDLEKAANKVNFDGLLDSVNQIADRFTLKGTIIRKFFDDIANRALDLEHRLEGIFFSMTGLEQATVGWNKYADKTSAVQTIMSAVANEVEDVGDRMKYVNKQLETLNWFTDETSYNFLDMVNNIGKFTANQVPLDMAVESMQGIATWAAKSGANVGEASRAMYNLSQAISSGALKLLDWKSIELANMGTAEFKQTAIETAEAMGELQKVAEGVWETVDGTEVSIKGFRDSLKTGWLSSNVLLATLNKYGGFATKLNVAVKETGLLTSDFLDAIEASKNGVQDLSEFFDDDARVDYERFKELVDDLSQSQYDFGRSAFAAAQEAKTFQEAVDAVKDAVSTGWMNSFEIIFGDYQEAKRLWTDLSNYLYDVFNSSAEYRNQMLQDWKDMGGRDDLLEGFRNLATALEGIFGAIGDAWRELFPEATWYDLVQLTKRFKTFTQSLILSDEALDGLRNTFVKIFTPVRTVVNILKTAGVVMLALALTLRDAAINVLTFIGESKGLGDLFSRLANKSRLFEAALGLLYTALYVLSGIFGVVGMLFDNFNKALQNQTGTRSFLGALGVIVSYIGGTFGDAILFVGSLFQKCFGFMAEHVFTAQNLATAFSWIKFAVEGVSGAMQAAFGWCFGLFQGFNVVEQKETQVIEKTEKTVEKFNLFQKIFDDMKKGFEIVAGAIGGMIKEIFSRNNIHSIEDFGTAIGNFFSRLNAGKVVALGVAAAMFILIRSTSNFLNAFASFVKTMTGFGDIFRAVTGYFNALTKATKYSALLQIGAGIMEIAAALWIVSKIPRDQLWETVEALSAMVVISAAFAGAMTVIASTTGEMLKASMAIATLGAGILVFVMALKQVQSLDLTSWEDVVNVLFLLGTFSASIIALGNFAPQFKVGAASMIAFSAAIYILATAFNKLVAASKGIDVSQIGVLVGIIAAYAGAMALMGRSHASAGAGVLLSVASMLLFIQVLKQLTSVKIADFDQFAVAFGAMIVAFGALVLAIAELSGPVLAAAAALGVSVGALYGVYLLMDRIANWQLNVENLRANGVLFAAAVIGIVRAIGMLAAMLPQGFALQANLGSLVGVGVALLAIAGGLKILSGTNWEDIRAGAIGLGLVLLALSLPLLLGSRFQASSRALVAVAIDIGAIVAALAVLSLLGDDVWPAAQALSLTMVTLAAAFFGASRLAATSDGKAIKAMMLDIAAIAIAIAGIVFYADSWEEVAAAAVGLGAAILALGGAMNLIGKINWNLKSLLGVASAAALAYTVGTVLAKFVTATGDKTWDQIITSLGGFAIAVMSLGTAVWLMGETSSWTGALFGALGAAAMVVSIAYSLSMMAPYSEQLPKIMDSFLAAVVVLTAATVMLSALKEYSIIGAGALAIVGLAALEFGEAVNRFGEGVVKFSSGVQSLGDAIEHLGNISNEEIKNAVTNISNFGLRMVGAIHDIYPKVEKAMYDSAGYLIRGLQNGLSDNQKDVNLAATTLFFGFQKKFEEAAQIQSPSVAMWKDGQYLIFGLVNGIVENQGYVYQAANGVWKYAHDGVEDDIENISDEEGQLYVDGIGHTIIDSKDDVQAALEELARDADSPEAIEEAEKSGKNIGKAVVSGAKEIIDSSGNMLLNFIKGTATGKKVTGYYEMLTGKEAIFLSKADEQNYKYMKRAGLTDAQIKQNLGYDPFDAMTIGAEKARRSFKDLVPDTSDLTDQFEELAGAAGYADIPGVGGSGAAGSVAALGEEIVEVADITEFASESIAYYQSKYEQLSNTLLDMTPWDMAVKSTEDLVLWRYKLINADDEAIQSIKNYAELTDEQLNAAADSWREYFDTVANGISQGFGSVFSAPTFAKGSFEAELTSFKDMMKNLKAQENQMTYFTNTLIKLKKEGLNEVYLQSLLDAGPENLTEIISWDQLTAEEIKRINAQYEKIQNATTRLTMEYIETTANTFGEMPQEVEKSIEQGISNMSTYEIQQDVYNKTSEILEKVLDADTDWEQFNGTRLGQLLDQGIADGVTDMKDVAVNAVSQLAREMIAELNTQVTNARAQQMQKMTDDWNSYVLGGMGGGDDDSPRSSNSRISDSEYDAIMSLKEAAGYLEYVSGSNNYDPSYKSTYEKMAKEGIDAVSNAKSIQNALDSSTVSGNLRAADLSGQISSAIATKTAEKLGSDASYSSSVSGSKDSGYNVSITQNNYSTSAHTAEKLTQDLKSVSASVKK